MPKYFIQGIITLFNPKKANEIKYNGKPVIPIIILSLTLGTYLICVFICSKWYVQQLKLDFLTNDILKTTEALKDEKQETIDYVEYYPDSVDKYKDISFMNVDFGELLSKNSDTVGWIKVNNTNVNYPVVQTSDNAYYLKHDFNKKSNRSGWVYADYRDDFKYFGNNSIIYAHNTRTDTMFSTLTWCLKDSWYTNADNHYIKVSTPTSNTVWKIFSIYMIKTEVYYLKTYFETEEEHQKFVDTIKGRSIYNFNEDISTEDKILTLSTCNNDSTKRIVIHAKMIKAEYK